MCDRRGRRARAAAIWEKLVAGGSRPRLSRLRSSRGAGGPHRGTGAVHAALPASHRREPPGLARAARALAPSGRQRTPSATRSICYFPPSSRIRMPSGSIRPSGARSANCTPAVARGSLQRAHRARGLLSRSPRLHALPLSQHRTALAMSALPRLEYLRRRAHRAGAGRHRGRGLVRAGSPPGPAAQHHARARGARHQTTETVPDSRITPSRVRSGRPTDFAAATMSASKGSRVNRSSSAANTCSGVRSSGW